MWWWPDELRSNLEWYPANDLDRLPALAESMTCDLTERFNRPHINRWRSGLRQLRYPLAENPVIQIAPDEWRRYVRGLERAPLDAIAARIEARHPNL